MKLNILFSAKREMNFHNQLKNIWDVNSFYLLADDDNATGK